MYCPLYPPLGNRGCGPLRAVMYGNTPIKEYIDDQLNNLCRFIQIESITAVKNLPEMVKNPYIDGYILGPFDLSGTIGKLSDVYCEENMALIKETISILKANGKCVGMSMTSTDEAEQRKWYELGANMVTSGADFDYIAKGAKKNVEQLARILKDYE